MSQRAIAHDEAAVHAGERELMARVAAGDHSAFVRLYCAYTPRLRAFLRRLLRQRVPVEEVLDDTMLVVWRKAASFNAHCALSTWIFAIAYRKALKALARLRLEQATTLLVGADGVECGPEAQLQQQQLQADVAAALARLSATHHAVLRLVYFQGYACREAADILRCPVDTVKTRMFHARRRMRGLLAAHRAAR